MTDAKGESELLAAARAGDDQALEELLARYQPQVYRFGLRMCRDDSDAEDVLQETLLAAARTLRGFRGAASVSTWLYSITRSFCIKKRRRSKFAPTAEVSLQAADGQAALELRDPARDPEELAASHELRQALERALRALEPAQREVLLLRDVEGLTGPEVAQVTGLSLEAVKSRLHRARAALRERLTPLLRTPEGRPGRRCPDVFAALERHLDGELSPRACAEMERHLADCPGCKGACDALRSTLALCRVLPAPQLPPGLDAQVRAQVRELLVANPNPR